MPGPDLPRHRQRRRHDASACSRSSAPIRRCRRADVLALLFSDVRRDGPGDVELRALQNPNERADRHPDDARDADARQPDLVRGRPGRRADLRRRHVPADAVADRSVQPVDRDARVNPSARVTIGKRISDRVYLTFSRSLSTSINDQILLLEYDESDRLSWILSRNEDADLRHRGPREAHLLMRARLKARPAPAQALLLLLLFAPVQAAPTSPTTSASRSPRSGWRSKAARHRRTPAPADPVAGRQPLSMLRCARRSPICSASATSRTCTWTRRPRRRCRSALRAGADPPGDACAFTGIAGAPGVDEGRLRRAVVDRYGASPPPGRAPDIARLVESELGRRGYLHARVSQRLELRARARSRDARLRDRTGRADHDRRGRGHRHARHPRARAPRSAGPCARRALRAGGAGDAHRRLPERSARARLLRGAARRPAAVRRRRSHRQPDARRARRARASASCSPAIRCPPTARRAGADRARGIGRRGSARGLEQPDQDYLRAQGYRDATARISDARTTASWSSPSRSSAARGTGWPR